MNQVTPRQMNGSFVLTLIDPSSPCGEEVGGAQTNFYDSKGK